MQTWLKLDNDKNDIYETFGEYNPKKKSKMFIVFNDMITDIFSNIKLSAKSNNYLLQVEN